MPYIQNVSLAAIQSGKHINPGNNAMCIQIVEPNMEFPTPYYTFASVHKYQFFDLEEADNYGNSGKITDEQAKSIVECLQYALANNMNVIVHCVMGICRSGAVCEVGTILGFEDTHVFRQPNLLVKHKMLKALNLTYE